MYNVQCVQIGSTIGKNRNGWILHVPVRTYMYNVMINFYWYILTFQFKARLSLECLWIQGNDGVPSLGEEVETAS